MVHIYKGILLSHKKEWNNAICGNTDGTRDYPTECHKSETERQIAHDIISMCNLKYDTNELIYETETHSQTHGTDLWLPRESVGGGGMDWEFEISRCKLLYIFQENWIIWLYTRNEHNTVNQLYFNKINVNTEIEKKLQISVSLHGMGWTRVLTMGSKIQIWFQRGKKCQKHFIVEDIWGKGNCEVNSTLEERFL